MDFLFPRNLSCICCNLPISEDNYLSLCKNCYKKLAFVEEICVRCGRFGKGASMCTQCATEKYDFDYVYSVLEYNDFVHHQIYAYKYGFRNYMGRYFGEMMKDFVRENEISYDFITAVPISSDRLKTRGFNQSEVMAKEIDQEAFKMLFLRNKGTQFLSGLSKARRILELQDAFSIDEKILDEMMESYYSQEKKDQTADQDKKIKLLIVDDILTTGSTINELSKLAKKHILNIEITALTLCSARK